MINSIDKFKILEFFNFVCYCEKVEKIITVQ